MPPSPPLLALMVFATVLDGILAGASLDQSIKQIPARHRMGMVAFSAYSRAADLGRGVAWYATLGIGAAVLTCGAAVAAYAGGAPLLRAFPLYLAAGTALAHSLATSRAAPINVSQRHAIGDEARLAAIFARFERWQTLRVVFQVITFGLMVWALLALAMSWSCPR